MLDLRADHLRLVQDILQSHVPGIEVRAFGSRVTDRAKPHSDLDLALIADQPTPHLTLALLEAAFSDSDLPFRVDVVDWATLSPHFRRIVAQRYEVVQQGARRP